MTELKLNPDTDEFFPALGKRSPESDFGTLQEMFSGKVDVEVIHMVYAETEKNFEKSLEQLLQLSTKVEGNADTEPPKLSMAEIAKQMTSQPREWKRPNGTVVRDSRVNVMIPSPTKAKVQIPVKVLAILNRYQNVMILMRGVPGSGKSTVADQIVRYQTGRLRTACKLSADDFFRRNGSYQFNASLLSAAHDWNHQRAEASCKEKLTLVVIDNTNMEAWEMEPYAAIAAANKFWLLLLEPETEWKNDAVRCARLNVHGVSEGTIERMLLKFDRNVTSMSIMAKYLPPGSTMYRTETAKPDAERSVYSRLSDRLHDFAPSRTSSNSSRFSSAMSSKSSSSSYSMCSSTSLSGPRPRLNHIFTGLDDWTIPDFPINPSPFEELKDASEDCLPVKICRNYGTQTSTRDFAVLETQQEGRDLLQSDIAFEDQFSCGEETFEVAANPMEVTTLEKGTEIPVFPGETVEEKLSKLKRQFADVPEAHIMAILKNCSFEQEWATSLLQSFEPDHLPFLSTVEIDGLSLSSSPSDGNSSWIEVEKPGTLSMAMDINFALDLQKEFGEIEGSPFDSLQINLDRETCAVIYEAWKKATAEQPKKRVVPPKLPPRFVASEEPTGEFQEIMNYELAMAQSLEATEDYEVDRTRRIVYRAYPGIAVEMLESVLASNDFNLKATLEQLRSNERAKNALSKKTVNDGRFRRCLGAAKPVAKFTLPHFYEGPPNSRPSQEEPEVRNKMRDLYQKQMEYTRRAKECISSKKFATASYYSEEAMRCRRMATNLIADTSSNSVSDTLDLHELRVGDALKAFREFVWGKKVQLQNSKKREFVLECITGYGSQGIPPKIKPAVIDYLQHNKIAYTLPNQGMVRFTLKR